MEVHEEPSLQEALQLVDDWAMDIAALFGLDNAPEPALPISPLPNMRRRKPSAKVERMELRQEIEQLQTRLNASCPPTALPLARGMFDQWSDIATRQREQRVQVEVENHKLRTIAAAQLKFARRSAVLVDKVKTIGTALGYEKMPSIDEYQGPQVDRHEQLQRLDDLAVEALSLFSSGLFALHANHDFRDVKCRDLNREGLLIELNVSWVLPFPVERIVNALWFHTTRMPRTERTTCFKDTYCGEDTLISHFVSESKILGTIQSDDPRPVTGSTHGQIATQRKPATSDGSVLLVSSMDVTNLHEDGTSRNALRGDGLLLVEPADTMDGSRVCRIKWCRRVLGAAPNDNSTAAVEYAQWVHGLTSRAMQAKWWRSIESNLQSIENMLLAAPHRPYHPKAHGATSPSRQKAF